MGRHKKNRRCATGVYSKNGLLYTVTTQEVIKDGVKVNKKIWQSTGLPDTPDNVRKATEARESALTRKGISTIDRNISVSAFLDEIMSRKKRKVTDTTYAAYLCRVNSIKKHLGNIKVKDLYPRIVESFLDCLFSDGKMQPRTVKDIKTFFGSVIEDAVKEGLISYNPVKEAVINKNLAIKYAKEKAMDDEFFSFEEAQFFLGRVQVLKKDLYELFYLTLFFGLRREEVLGLRWSAVDLKNKTMVINHTVTKGTRVNRLNSTKTTASQREYPLSGEQVELFNHLKQRENKNRILFGPTYHENDYIFKNADGRPYYPDYPSKEFRKLIKKIPELPQSITFHGLRSSCVSILVHSGLDVKSIQKWAGHANLTTTLEIYAKVKDKESKAEISSGMSRLIQLDPTSKIGNIKEQKNN